MESVCFKDGTILHIEENVLTKLFVYMQRNDDDKEAGGVLIGRQVNGAEEYYLCDISEPTALDKRSRFAFVRNKVSAQKVIDGKWQESAGIDNYLGEWHSHPENKPSPSYVDRRLISQIIRDGSNVFPKVFLIIVGRDQSLYIGVANSVISDEISTSLVRSFL